MLHILFLILKIIGIMLAVILGILVLLVCVVFFVPIRYQSNGKCDGTLESIRGIIKISWFFNLFRVNVKYDNGRIKYSVKIAWKSITGEENNEKNKKKMEPKTDIERTSPESVAYQKSEKMSEESKKRLEGTGQEIEKRTVILEKSEETDSTDEKKISITEKIKKKINNIREKTLKLEDKIKCTIKDICDKLKIMLEKKDKIMKFIQDKNRVKAFLKLKKELFKLLKRLRPKEYLVKAKYGFDDPALTGKILAVISMIFPFTEEHMEIIPCFESKVLKGNAMIKGKLYIIHFICLAWNLVWCKDIRILYKDVRNFKL